MVHTLEKMKVYELFKLARALQDHTQDVVAKEAGISRATLAQFETGKPSISAATVREIALFLNINHEWLDGTSPHLFRSRGLVEFYVDGKDLRAPSRVSSPYCPIAGLTRSCCLVHLPVWL
jgi:transcriptional regulator with XRE-family HTH domain